MSMRRTSRPQLFAAVVALVTAVALTPVMARFIEPAAAQAVTSAILFVGSVSSPTAVAATTGQIHVLVKDEIPGVAATNLGKAEDAASASADTGVSMLFVRKDTNATLTSADGDYVQPSADNYGAIFARSDHPNRISCVVAVSTATTITAVGNSCVAPGAGLSIYVTDIEFGSSAAAGTAADSFPTLKYGTGGTCGAGTAVFWQGLTAANTTAASNYTTPFKVPANNEVCWIMSTAGSKTLQIHGFIAP